jgi:hypothetical protein
MSSDSFAPFLMLVSLILASPIRLQLHKVAYVCRDQWRPSHGTQVLDAKEGDGGGGGTAPWAMSG